MFERRTVWQLTIFGILTALSMSIIAFQYVRVQDMAGLGHREITLRFDDASGLYPGALVTYRGVQVGTVDHLDLGTGAGADVVVSLDEDRRIPADVTATAHSTSAIGENYIDLTSDAVGGPYLASGSVVSATRTKDLEPTGALLDNLNAVAASLPREQTRSLLKEVTAAFAGSRGDVGRLIRSANRLLAQADADLPAISALLSGLPTLLGTTTRIAPDLTAAARDLAGFTGSLADSGDDLSAALRSAPGALDEVTALTSDLQSDVPVLLSDLLSTGQVLKVYLPGIEQILVVYPGVMSAIQSAATNDGAPGSIKLGARLTVNRPPNCYTGFLPLTQQRDYNDESRRADVPDDLYCKVAHDDPRAVRGARNTPCLNNPGVRAASVEECLGYPIGADIDPIGRPREAVATYDPRTGRVLTPDGRYFEIGGVGSQPQRAMTWQNLLLR